jgi:hypothetical protein
MVILNSYVSLPEGTPSLPFHNWPVQVRPVQASFCRFFCWENLGENIGPPRKMWISSIFQQCLFKIFTQYTQKVAVMGFDMDSRYVATF